MSIYRISARFYNNTLLAKRPDTSYFNSLINIHTNKVASGQASPVNHLGTNLPVLQQFGFSSSRSLRIEDQEKSDSDNGANNSEREAPAAETSGNADMAEKKEASTSNIPGDSNSYGKSGSDAKLGSIMERMKKWMYGTNTDLSGTDSGEDLTTKDLIKLVTEKDELLMVKGKEIENMQEKVSRSYAEMENVIARTRREAENSKKFAIQSFAKGLLDVADNLGRASSVVKESFSKIDTSKDSSGALPLLKTLLEGVEMTEKQLAEVFKKFGVEKYDPAGEQFDPNRHNAVYQVPDASKPSGTVAVVLKSGYVLHDRVLRPAEVGVTDAVENTEAEQGS